MHLGLPRLSRGLEEKGSGWGAGCGVWGGKRGGGGGGGEWGRALQGKAQSENMQLPGWHGVGLLIFSGGQCSTSLAGVIAKAQVTAEQGKQLTSNSTVTVYCISAIPVVC